MTRRSGFANMPAELDRAAEQARAAGWTVTCRSTGHACWKPPGGGPVIFTAGTPSDHRSTRNDLARLRRAGLDLR